MTPSESEELDIVREAAPFTLPHPSTLTLESLFQNRPAKSTNVANMENITKPDEVSDDDLTLTRAEAQEECDRRNNPVMTEPMMDLIRYIEGLYNAGAKLWTKDMFRQVEAALGRWPPKKHTGLRSMNDAVIPKLIPDQDHKVVKVSGREMSIWSMPCVRYYLYQDLKERVTENEYDLNPDATFEELSDMMKKTLATRAMSIALITYVPSATPVSAIKSKWDQIVSHDWPQSQTFAKVTEILKEKATIPGFITKVVCFGLGSLGWSIELASDESKENEEYPAIFQHAAALTIAKVVGERLGRGPLSVFSQDPIYSNADKEVLAAIGIQVLGARGGLGFTLVDDRSLVITCNPNIPVKQVIADIARPPIIVCNEVKEECGEKWKVIERDDKIGLLSPYTTDHDSPRTREMVRGYDKFPLPDDPANFSDLHIYVRKD